MKQDGENEASSKEMVLQWKFKYNMSQSPITVNEFVYSLLCVYILYNLVLVPNAFLNSPFVGQDGNIN